MKVGIGEKVRFQCTRCARCCSTGPNVALTIYDVARIARYLGVPWRVVLFRHVKVIVADMVPFMLLRGICDTCVFLEGKPGSSKCRIYPARPLRCALYPWKPIAPGSESLEVYEKCPGVGNGDPYAPPRELVEAYYEEIRRHYRAIMERVLSGTEPSRALEEALEEAYDEVSSNIEDWPQNKCMESIG